MKLSKWGMSAGLAISAVTLAACGSGGSGPSTEGNEELFTTEGFEKAFHEVEEKAGEDAEALEVQITEGGATFKLREGEQATGFVYTGHELHDVEVNVIGPGSLEGESYPLSEVEPEAIDEIVSGVKEKSGVSDLKITVMTFDKGIDGELKWTVNAEGGGRTGLVYFADPDGHNVTSPQGEIAGAHGDETTHGEDSAHAKTPEEIAQCVSNADGNIAKLQACTQ